MIDIVEVGEHKLIRQDGLTQSCIPPYDHGYWKQMIPTDKQNVKSALILGLGAGTIAREIRERWPDARIEGVDADREMIKLARREFEVMDFVNIIFHRDAFQFVRECESKYDLVIVDLYDGFNFSLRVITNEFLDDCKQLLREGGVLSVNVPCLDQCESQFQNVTKSPFNKIYFYEKNTIVT